MEHWVASIFHLTDLHLFIDEDGKERPLGERHVTVRALEAFAKRTPLRAVKSLVSGFSLPDMKAWRLLLKRLPRLIASERTRAGQREAARVPIIVLQTGDVETFGHRPAARASGPQNPYPGFTFLENRLWPALRAAGADATIDLFGNHDVWEGTNPLFTPRDHVRNALTGMAAAPGLAGPWPDRRDFAAPGGVRLEIYRVNSVPPGPLLAALATGSIGPHPRGTKLPITQNDDALMELYRRTKAPPPLEGDGAIRILAIHHPPHFFEGTFATRLTSGRLVESLELAACAEYSRIHLVMAGHRHQLDPPEGARYDGRSVVPNQLPFNATRGQLVAESPTAHSELREDAGRNSFSLYRLYVDDDREVLRVERAVAVYRERGTAFAAYGWENTFLELPW
jgi:hypothetical protein